MVRKNTSPFEPSHEDYSPEDLEIARALAQCADLLAAGEVQSVHELLQKSPRLGVNIAHELQTLDEVGAILDSPEPPRTFGEFVRLERLNGGGMGIVYVARQTKLNRLVALKVLPPGLLNDPNHVARFQREAVTTASLHHPNIVTVYETGVEDGQPYYAMELVDGETLLQAKQRMQSTRLSGNTPLGAMLTPRELFDSPAIRSSADVPGSPEQRSPLAPTHEATMAVAGSDEDVSARSPRAKKGCAKELDVDYCHRVVEAFIGAADGLQHAHSRGIVHRDLKPSNLIKDSEGRLRILDFGLAWVEGETRLTRTTERPGTLPYMSPEQIEGRNVTFGPAVDIFSLGATLYEMLTWTPAFQGTTRPALARAIDDCNPLPVRWLNRNVSRGLETIVMKCLRKDPRERYVTARELAEDLRAYVEVREADIKARPLPWAVRTARRTWAARAKVATWTGTAACVIAAAVLFALQAREERRLEDAGLNKIVRTAGSSIAASYVLHRTRSAGVGIASRVAPPAKDPRSGLEPGISDGAQDRMYDVKPSVFEAGPMLISVTPFRVNAAVAQLVKTRERRPADPIVSYYLASEALIRGNVEEANQTLLDALHQDPKCVPALCLLATLHERESDQAAGLLRGVIHEVAKVPGKEWASALIEVKRAELELRWDDAVKAGERLAELLRTLGGEEEPYPGALFETRLGLAVARLRKGDLFGAVGDLAFCEKLSPDSPEPALLLGKISYLQEGAKSGAKKFEDLFSKAKGEEKDATALSIAEVLRDLGRPKEGLRWTKRARSRSAKKFWLESDLYAQDHQRREALDAARDAVAIAPQEMEGYLVLGNAYAIREDYREAEGQYELARALKSKDPRPLVARASCLELQGNFPDAERALRDALECGSETGLVFYTLGRVLSKEGPERLEEAMDSYERAIKADSGQALAYNNLGTLHSQRGETDEARLCYEKAAQIAPQLGVAHANLGWAYVHLRLFGLAADHYQRAKANGVKDPDIDANLAVCLFWTEDYGNALNLALAALKAQSKNPLWHYNLASIYFWMKNRPLCLQATKEAAELDPKWPNVHTDLGVELEADGRFLEAAGEHEKSTDLDPNLSWGYNNEAALRLWAPVPEPEGEELEAAIRRMENGLGLSNESLAVRWLVERYRRRIYPRIASYASIDALVDGPRLIAGEREEWSYQPGIKPPPEELDWVRKDFNDSSWKKGMGSFGYPADRGHATVLSDMKGAYRSLNLRKKFTVADPARVKRLLLSVRLHDSFTAYLNGHEAGGVPLENSESPAPGDEQPTTQGDHWRAASLELNPAWLEPGENVLAVEGVNRRIDDDEFALSPVLEAVFAFDEERRLDLEAALRAFEARAKEDGADAAARATYFAGCLLEKQERFADAEAKLQEVVALDSSRPEPYIALAKCRKASGRGAAAEQLLREALGSQRLVRFNELWIEWFRLAMVDLAMPPAEVLRVFPDVPSIDSHREWRVNPSVPSDLNWLAGRLASGGPILINCGGADYREEKDGGKRQWSHDRFYRTGWPDYFRDLDGQEVELQGDRAIYQTLREFEDLSPRFTAYSIPLPKGWYRVTLHFIEGKHTESGHRSFGVALEGKTVLEVTYDPFRKSFGEPHSPDFTVAVEDGTLDIDFLRGGDNPVLSGIEVARWREKGS